MRIRRGSLVSRRRLPRLLLRLLVLVLLVVIVVVLAVVVMLESLRTVPTYHKNFGVISPHPWWDG